LIDQTTTELNYLLTGKTVEVSVNPQSTTVLLAKTPVTLVLNNLIRNAFQHTQKGRVEIIQVGNKISIFNDEDIIESQTTQSELGFGLGTQLVENLIKRFDWNYEKHQENTTYYVRVSF
jgi:signal transduction histidine kinase